ncbi:hypothetical protein HMPREF1356_01036 [Enterococcus faecium C1904]|nr:hypothetical protein HMPREF1356_01036 [Enterococcus faecium C1904]
MFCVVNLTAMPFFLRREVRSSSAATLDVSPQKEETRTGSWC